MNSTVNNEPNRRDFVQLVSGWCATLFALAASGAAAARFMMPNVLYEADRRYRALKPDDYPEGATFLPDARLFVLRKGNSFRAVSAVCTHLGCTVLHNNDGNGFHCPCHGSQFNENAAVTGGPAPKPLPWYLMTLTRDGRLMIDASQEVKPDKYLVV
ncbi:MAG: ubiquinol-cytochrome c reductase iron-sulfur subunit [Verrucomicrobia bacterium]|nr:ubiquinol-cytochrome c reductase iron-sulfur subunit [Verrucomicrobiota bacterium]